MQIRQSLGTALFVCFYSFNYILFRFLVSNYVLVMPPFIQLTDKELQVFIKTFTKKRLVFTNNNFRHLTTIVLKEYTYNIVTVIT